MHEATRMAKGTAQKHPTVLKEKKIVAISGEDKIKGIGKTESSFDLP